MSSDSTDDIVRGFEHQLSRPFPSRSISWRIGSTSERDGKVFGLPLSFIDARDVAERLDEVCGLDGWKCSYPVVATGGITVCRLELRIAGEWIAKEDGAGSTDVEAEKGTLSDSFKRAAVRFGIGRYLYGLKADWIELEVKGNRKVIPKAAYDELEKMHDKAITEAEWGDREDRNTVRLLTAALKYFDTGMLEAFEREQEGTIRMLRVGSQGHLKTLIDHLGRELAAKPLNYTREAATTATKAVSEFEAGKALARSEKPYSPTQSAEPNLTPEEEHAIKIASTI